MRKVILLLFGICTSHFLHSQTCTSSITANGPTTFCEGGSVVLSANTGNAWVQKANFMGTSRRYAAGFSIGSKGYIGTGFDGAYKRDFWEYDANTNVWTQKANYGGSTRRGGAGMAIGNRGYIGTGYNGKYLKDFWEYNPDLNTWTKRADYKGDARTSAVAFSIGNKGYLGTGNDGKKKSKNDFYEYNPATNKWTKLADYAGGVRMGAVGFSINGMGYIGTGSVFNGKEKGDDNEENENQNIEDMTKDFWQYNPITNTWTRRADFPGSARYFATGFSIGGRGYIGTGSDVITRKADFWEYNAQTNSWAQLPDFGGTARQGATGFSIGCAGFIGTGSTGALQKDFWQYNGAISYLWSTNETTQSITVSTSGSYTVTVTNPANGVSTTSQPVVVTVNPPTSSETTVAICNSYTWNGNTYNQSGDYVYTTTNANGCDSTATLHLTILSVTSTYTVTDALCFGEANGSITVTPTSGVGPYQYRIGTVGGFGPSNTFTGLRAGSYRVFIQDAEGCNGVTDAIIVGEQSIITATYNVTEPACANTFTGSLEILASGGTPPYQYRLGTSGGFVNSNVFTNLRAGSYRVYIMDANGCTINSAVIINQPAAVTASAMVDNATCIGATDGKITMSASGGTPPYEFRFGTAGTYSTNNVFSNLKANNYRIFTRDANGCGGGSIVVAVGEVPVACGIVSTKASKLVESNSLSNKVSPTLIPNPTRNQFTLQLPVNNKNVQVRVIDVNGRCALTLKATSGQRLNFGSQLAPGIYIIELQDGEKTTLLKGVKIK